MTQRKLLIFCTIHWPLRGHSLTLQHIATPYNLKGNVHGTRLSTSFDLGNTLSKYFVLTNYSVLLDVTENDYKLSSWQLSFLVKPEHTWPLVADGIFKRISWMKVFVFDLNFTEFYLFRASGQFFNNTVGSSLLPDRRQAITSMLLVINCVLMRHYWGYAADKNVCRSWYFVWRCNKSHVYNIQSSQM